MRLRWVLHVSVWLAAVLAVAAAVGSKKRLKFSLRQARRFAPPSPCTHKLAASARLTLHTASELVQQAGLSPWEAAIELTSSNVTLESLGITGCTLVNEVCSKEVSYVCDPTSPYRTITGTCNNLQYPRWGTSHSELVRYLVPQYGGDGVGGTPRVTAVSGAPLPSARLISSSMHESRSSRSNWHTLLMMQWGQFLDHDITLTPVITDHDGEHLECCGDGHDPLSADCFPIEIPHGDILRHTHTDGCMEFTRSQPTTTEACTLDVKQQINQITSYIDASNVYGSTAERQRSLRAFLYGLLRAQPNPYGNPGSKEWLPDEAEHTECSDSAGRDVKCFLGGDSRTSEQPALTSMHTVWMREHNRIARTLSHINPHWSDDTLYEETRRIVGALMQHITYNEFLPEVLGPEHMGRFGLTLTGDGYYDQKINAGASNVFATAAFRFGHTLLADQFARQSHMGGLSHPIDISQTFFTPEWFNGSYPRGPDPLMVGLCDQRAEGGDSLVTPEVTQRLFIEPGAAFGVDLVALNIQRGRDHGLPPYNRWREWCGLGKVSNFIDLLPIMEPPHLAIKYSKIYGSVYDIDLFTAGISERAVPNAEVGETFACILATQFRDLKRGDRFWYENSFNPGQLREIKKVKLSKVVCLNSDNLFDIQPRAMRLHNPYNNKITPCLKLPSLNLELWRDTPPMTTNIHVEKQLFPEIIPGPAPHITIHQSHQPAHHPHAVPLPHQHKLANLPPPAPFIPSLHQPPPAARHQHATAFHDQLFAAFHGGAIPEK